jgi:hypothetical protein
MSKAIIMTIESVRTRASTNEALVTFAIPLEMAAHVSGFMNKVGRQVGCAFADVDATTRQADDPAPPSGKTHNWRQDLAASVFLRTPQVWRAAGTDEEFLEFLRDQKCVYCGKQDLVYETGEGKCEAAHIRKVSAGAGISIKPEYSAVPLCHEHHALQHKHGASFLMPEEEWQKERIKMLKEWVWSVIKNHLGVASMSDVQPEQVRKWAADLGVEQFLPVSML